MAKSHNPAARYCVMGDQHIIPIDDTVDCAACQESHDLLVLDPDFAEEFKDYPRPTAKGATSMNMGQRVRHRTGQLGLVVGQQDGDPIVHFDGDAGDRVCYRSEIRPSEDV